MMRLPLSRGGRRPGWHFVLGWDSRANS